LPNDDLDDVLTTSPYEKWMRLTGA
jgi:hypothetical protein